MKSIETLPPVIVALDVPNISRAREITENLVDYPRDVLAYQLRAPHMHSDFMHDLIDEGYFVIGGTRFEDAPTKIVIDLHATLSRADEHGNNRSLPHALTISPSKSTDDIELDALARSIRGVHRVITRMPGVTVTPAHRPKTVNVSLIATARPENFHPSDHSQIADQAINSYDRARRVGIDAHEIVFNGLQGFLAFRHMSDGVFIASKLSLSSLKVKEAAKRAYGLGVKSILLGDSVVKSKNPRLAVEEVLGSLK